jgi:hypothetical protein
MLLIIIYPALHLSPLTFVSSFPCPCFFCLWKAGIVGALFNSSKSLFAKCTVSHFAFFLWKLQSIVHCRAGAAPSTNQCLPILFLVGARWSLEWARLRYMYVSFFSPRK